MKFSVKDKLCAICEIEVKGVDKQSLDSALDEIGEDVSAPELYDSLCELFGSENVTMDGNEVTNICSENEYEFLEWGRN